MIALEAFDIFDKVVGSPIFETDPELKLEVLRVAITRNHLGENAFMLTGLFPSEKELSVHPDLEEIFCELKEMYEAKCACLATRI